MSTETTIREKLEKAFAPARLEVIDDSESHRGHGGFREGVQTHFNLVIRAEAFNGVSRVARQRMVMKVLKDELEGPVHALAMDVAGTED